MDYEAFHKLVQHKRRNQESLRYSEDAWPCTEDEFKLLLLGFSGAGNQSNLQLGNRGLLAKVRLDNDDRTFKKSPHQLSNTLGILPLEIWMQIFLTMDLKTLTVLRAVSQLFRNTISEIPQYALILKHTPDVIRAALATGIAVHINLAQVYRAIISTACAVPNCPNDANYLYFLRVERLCSIHAHRISLHYVDERLIQLFDRSENTAIQGIPRMHGLRYQSKTRIYVDRYAINRLLKKGIQCPWLSNCYSEVRCRPDKSEALETCIEIPFFDRGFKTPYIGYTCHGESSESDSGKLLSYTRNGFLKHIKNCPAAQRIWEQFKPEKTLST